MSKGLLQNIDFDVNCPGCKKKFSVNMQQVGKSVICPHCRKPIQLSDAGISKSVRDVDKAISSIFKRR